MLERMFYMIEWVGMEEDYKIQTVIKARNTRELYQMLLKTDILNGPEDELCEAYLLYSAESDKLQAINKTRDNLSAQIDSFKGKDLVTSEIVNEIKDVLKFFNDKYQKEMESLIAGLKDSELEQMISSCARVFYQDFRVVNSPVK